MNAPMPQPLHTQLRLMHQQIASDQAYIAERAVQNRRQREKPDTTEHNQRNDEKVLAAIAAGHNTQSAMIAHTDMTRGAVRYTAARLYGDGRIVHAGRKNTGDKRETVYAIAEQTNDSHRR